MNLVLSSFRACLLCSVMLASAAVHADWALDGEGSSLGFVSVKNGRIAEGHTFTALSGGLDENGARLVVDLSSVDTLIPIRNERMREMLFEVARHPQAVFRADVDVEPFLALEVGESLRADLDGTLSLHGVEAPLTAQVLVTRQAAGRISVATIRPVVVSADAFSLGSGVTALREIAGLESITPMVPVNFSLSFRRER